jgi:hypothetical protein
MGSSTSSLKPSRSGFWNFATLAALLGDYKVGSCRQNLVEVGREEKEVTGDHEMLALLEVDFLVLGRRGNIHEMSATVAVTRLWRNELNLGRRRSYDDE